MDHSVCSGNFIDVRQFDYKKKNFHYEEVTGYDCV